MWSKPELIVVERLEKKQVNAIMNFPGSISVLIASVFRTADNRIASEVFSPADGYKYKADLDDANARRT